MGEDVDRVLQFLFAGGLVEIAAGGLDSLVDASGGFSSDVLGGG